MHVLACQAAVPGKEPGEGEPFRSVKAGWIVASAVDGAAVVIGAPPGRAGTGGLGQFRSQRLAETQLKPPGLVTLCHRHASVGARQAL